jgi:hypothetical protein
VARDNTPVLYPLAGQDLQTGFMSAFGVIEREGRDYVEINHNGDSNVNE